MSEITTYIVTLKTEKEFDYPKAIDCQVCAIHENYNEFFKVSNDNLMALNHILTMKGEKDE